MTSRMKENNEVIYEFDSEKNLLIIPKKELNNIDIIISKLKAKTELSFFEIYDLELKII